ncbi:MAG: hypothetical protein AAF762_07135 [Pseudomonadota bacterium]
MPFDPSKGGAVFSGDNGTVILEAESASPRGDWSSRTVDGERVLLWNSDRSNYNRVEESETLRYLFKTDESGKYSIAMHSGRVKSVMNDSDRFENGNERTDTGNDAYVGIRDAVTGEVIKVPTKLFTGLGSSDQELRWGTKFDDRSGHYNAEIQLQANRIYELEIVGRSDGYVLDRITLNKGGFLRDDDTPASARETIPPDNGNNTPPAAPPADPAPTPPSDQPGDRSPETEDSDGGGGFFDSFVGIFESIFDAIASIFGGGSDDDDDNQVATASAQVFDEADIAALMTAPVDDTSLPEDEIDVDDDDLLDVALP